MKRIAAFVVFALVSLGMVSSARAQDHQVRVAIPFDFTFGRVLLPAGTYTISWPSQVAVVLDNGKQSAAVLRSAPAEDDSSRADKVIFNKYGDQYFLREVLCSTVHMNAEFPASKMEKKAQHQKASLNDPDRVLIALNN
jgi:hypothetical protein